MAQSKRERNEILRSQLEMERSTFIPTWRDLAEYILPRRPRFFVQDVNKGERRSSKIIDSTATQAVGTLVSGMMAGMSSPARPWFRITTPDEGLADFGPVKEWLYQVTTIMETSFARGNVYNALPTAYMDESVFATAGIFAEEDFDDVSRFTSFPIGSYMIGTDELGRVNVFFREFQMTVRQLVSKFGRRKPNGDYDWSNFSKHVRELWEKGSYQTWIAVCHVVQVNDDYDATKMDSKFKRFASVYYEKGYAGKDASNYIGSQEDLSLRESGYDNFPFLAPRWQTTGEDTYGTWCPGLVALGDIKQLQLMEKRSMQAIEKMVNPPMVADPDLRTTRTTILPGDINYIRELDGKPRLRPAHEVDPRIQELSLKQQESRNRINAAFFVDMFRMFANSDRRNMTAAEVAERHEEKLFALGPMLEQQNQDLFKPLIDIQFDYLLRQNAIPPAPPELEGMKLKVEFVSIMAQAQKLVGVSNIERFAGFVGDIVAITKDPTHLDKVDIDQMIDAYGDATSVPPGIIRPDEVVAQIKEGRAQAEAEQRQAEVAAMAAKGARDLASAKLGEDNALKRIVDQVPAGQEPAAA